MTKVKKCIITHIWTRDIVQHELMTHVIQQTIDYYNPINLTFRDNEDRKGRQLDVTQVRPNDGENLNETITQPAKPITNN